MASLTKQRICLHIGNEIIHPAHIPLHIKAESALGRSRCHLRPCGRFFCDQPCSRTFLFKDLTEIFKKLDRLKIFITAIHVGNPFAILLAIVQIKHRSNRIHADTICMITFHPEQCICNQKIRHLRASVIVDQSAPVRMLSLPWIQMLIQTGSVKSCQTILILRKMCRNPVQDHADSLLMQMIDEIHKVLRTAIARCHRIIIRHLISPGFIQRMLHHRHKLHMCIVHFLDIIC